MRFRNTLISILALALFSSNAAAQNCDCTLMEVESNSVTPCPKIIGTIDTVYTTNELKTAINNANSNSNMTVLIADGSYAIASTSWYPYITGSNIVFRSLSGNRDSVILHGGGNVSVSPNTESGFQIVGDNVTIADLTIKDVGNHGIAMTGDSIYIHNVKIQDTYEQMIKGNASQGGSDNSTVQCSYFEYTAGIGPNWYIGGLDIHRGDNWHVHDNIFKNIISPHTAVAEHAIHFWDSSSNALVERNQIINCDRGIGFGLGSSSNEGGIIRNNMIYNNGTGDYDDVGIGLETSPNTKVYNNTVYIEYANAIEYRFAATTGVDIKNNLTNRTIKPRDGGSAIVGSNEMAAQSSWFLGTTNGNLRLGQVVAVVVDGGTDLGTQFSDDIDRGSRPNGSGWDMGAHEYMHPMGVDDEMQPFNVSPNPASSQLKISGNIQFNFRLLDLQGRVIKSASAVQSSQLDVSELASGMYILELQSKGRTENRKILIRD